MAANLQIQEPGGKNSQTQRSQTTAHPDEIRECLLYLAKLTRAPASQETDARVVVSAMVKYLSEYPIDIIRAACDEWVKTKVFFPVIAELREICDRRVRARKPLTVDNPLLLEPTRRDWESLSDEKRAEFDRMMENLKHSLSLPAGIKL